MSSEMRSKVRRGIVIGAAVTALGVALVVLALGDSLSTILVIPGGLLVLVGLLRLLGMGGVLAFERQRLQLLASGTVGTAVIDDVKQLPARGPETIFEMEVTVSAPGVEATKVRKRGSVPAQYADAMVPGAEFPVRLDERNPQLFAIDWNAA